MTQLAQGVIQAPPAQGGTQNTGTNPGTTTILGPGGRPTSNSTMDNLAFAALIAVAAALFVFLAKRLRNK